MPRASHQMAVQTPRLWMKPIYSPDPVFRHRHVMYSMCMWEYTVSAFLPSSWYLCQVHVWRSIKLFWYQTTPESSRSHSLFTHSRLLCHSCRAVKTMKMMLRWRSPVCGDAVRCAEFESTRHRDLCSVQSYIGYGGFVRSTENGAEIYSWALYCGSLLGNSG